MTPEEAYKKHKKLFASSDANEWRRPMATSTVIIKDGNIQLFISEEDRAVLIAAGMPESLFTQVREFLDGYDWVDGLYATGLCSSTPLRIEWDAAVDDGVDLRAELIKYTKFGIRVNRLHEFTPIVKKITKGVGPDDLIDDLKEIHQLLKDHPEIVAGLKQFSPAWVDESLLKHTELNALRTKLRATSDCTNLDILHAEKRGAFTAFQNAVDELRGWGQFVFEGSPRADKYRAQYLIGRKTSKKESEKPLD